ncbi:efflux RND transporter periplasmic adaptor subunit [Rhodobacterales bacterium HKCCE3408]|nr:efflux RND transporter periplasmic adaptor subunit [Rhodobacterales bacterium HKCCE3408]
MRPIGPALALLLGIVPASAQDASSPAPPRPVVVAEVEGGNGSLTRQFFGQVAAAQTVDLAFQVGGQLEDFPVIEGQTVPEGALVAQLDLAPFELALQQAEARFDQAERAVDRLTRLQGTAASPVALEDAQTEARLAEIAVDSARLDLEHATLRSPFAGLVASRNVSNYTTISPGTPVVRLHDMSDIRIEIDVPEILFQRAGADPDLSIFARFPASDEEYPVTIREFNAEASSVGQTFGITLGMAPPEGLSVLPGSSATIVATIGSGDGPPHIPPTAVAMGPDGSTSVFVFDAGTDTVSERPIELGADAHGRPVVLSGLEPGEEIVIAGVNALSDGMQVRRFDGFPD